MKHAAIAVLVAAVSLSLTGLVAPAGATVIKVAFDIKPGSCPNPINPPDLTFPPSFPTAIAGTGTLDPQEIDTGSLVLVVPTGGGLTDVLLPISVQISDVATAFFPDELCECIAAGADGTDDLSIHFDRDALEAALGPREHGEEISLCIAGMLLDGTPFTGCDCVIVVGPTAVEPETWGTLKNLYR